MTEAYSAKNLSVLEGLDAVRKRPGMYIGTTDTQGLMHCLWEILDNAVDEALAGACDAITVTIHRDGSLEVADNGRGIPVDIEPKTKLSGVEVVLTKLHAGAKFGSSSYQAVGGLHGVGSSVVNALSSRLDVEVDRDGHTYHMAFHQGHPGVYDDAAHQGQPSPDAPFKRTRKNRATTLEVIATIPPKRTGTRIRYWADPEIFNATAAFDYEQLIDRVRQTTFLVPGLRISVIDERVDECIDKRIDERADEQSSDQAGEHDNTVMREQGLEASEALETSEALKAAGSSASPEFQREHDEDVAPQHARVVTFQHAGGVRDFVAFLAKGQEVSRIWHVSGKREYVEESQVVDEQGELQARQVTRSCDVDIALQWVDGYDTVLRSFVNVVETPGGGTHVDGFLQALTKQVRRAVEENARKLKINAKDARARIERDDILTGLVAVVTVRLSEPQFQGQTKDVLGTAPVKPLVANIADEQLAGMLLGTQRGYKDQSMRVLEKIVGEMRARVLARKTKEVTRRKSALESAAMPSKLSDCLPGNDDIAELFIVEGDSALGTAKAARNSVFQALLPIRGKILNVQKASLSQMLANKECAAIIQVIGAGSGATFDISQARYHKIIMMTDADVDGAHIRILLLTLMYRYLRPLIEQGHVYAAVPPLHRISLTGKRKGEYVYTYSDDELARKLEQLRQRNVGFSDDIQRYKGLGEMDADQLADTTMDPRTRLLRRIRMEDAEGANATFQLLMGGEVPPRKQFIVDNADDFDRSNIDT